MSEPDLGAIAFNTTQTQGKLPTGSGDLSGLNVDFGHHPVSFGSEGLSVPLSAASEMPIVGIEPGKMAALGNLSFDPGVHGFNLPQTPTGIVGVVGSTEIASISVKVEQPGFDAVDALSNEGSQRAPH